MIGRTQRSPHTFIKAHWLKMYLVNPILQQTSTVIILLYYLECYVYYLYCIKLVPYYNKIMLHVILLVCISNTC